MRKTAVFSFVTMSMHFPSYPRGFKIIYLASEGGNFLNS